MQQPMALATGLATNAPRAYASSLAADLSIKAEDGGPKTQVFFVFPEL